MVPLSTIKMETIAWNITKKLVVYHMADFVGTDGAVNSKTYSKY